MEGLQGFIQEYGETIIKKLQLTPEGLAHFEPWLTSFRESYASAVAAYIMSYLYKKSHDFKYLECFSGLLKRSISQLKSENEVVRPFTKVFIVHYSLMAILILPDKEKKIYINITKNIFTAFKDKCYALNTNCASLQYGNEIFMSCINPDVKNVLFLDQLLKHIEKNQNVLGFINDSCAEGEEPVDGMPIAYHIFCCYLLIEVLLVDADYHVVPVLHRKRIENIILTGMKWLSYATFDVGDVAMAERSCYQIFTMGIQAALVAICQPKQVAKVLERFLHQYGSDENIFCCTPNAFSASMRVGFESYTRTNDYNNLNVAGFITADLCINVGILLFQNEKKEHTGLFTDANSGYAFYRNQYGFMGISLRDHQGGYLLQGSGFHYRLKNCQLPLANPRDNVANTISETIKIAGGGIHSSQNAMVEEIKDGVQIRYGNDSFGVEKNIYISESRIKWNYSILLKNEANLSESLITLSVPLIVDDGKDALKIISEISYGIIFEWHDSWYILKYDNVGKGSFNTNLSLSSVSGVGSNFEITLPTKGKNSSYIETSVELILIQKEEINSYGEIKDKYTEIENSIVLVTDMVKDCTGCGVCAKLCPQKCITMQRDNGGFLYPVIDKDICTGCNVCKYKCPINNRPIVNSYTRPFVYAAYSFDMVNRKASSSGGIFGEFVKATMENDGTAFAAKYNPFPTVAFSKINTIEEICSFHGSKYVESELGDVFTEVKKELSTGKKVLFVGLPCQVAGLLCFLQESYVNLFTVDFVCGGVPSPLYFETWILALENLYQCKILDYKFRNKVLGWSNNISSIIFSSGKEHFIDKKYDIYYQDYQKGINVRKGCFNCQFYGMNTVADITIGDFNGALHYSQMREETDEGISVVSVNSEKGNELVQICKKNVEFIESNFLIASRYNYRMKEQRIEPEERAVYLKDISLFKEKIYSDFYPDALCFYKVENPCERAFIHTPIKWTVYVHGTKKVEYAWYLYHNSHKICTVWYNEKNVFEYIPELAGEYYTVVFAKYKDSQDKIALKLQKVIVEL